MLRSQNRTGVSVAGILLWRLDHAFKGRASSSPCIPFPYRVPVHHFHFDIAGEAGRKERSDGDATRRAVDGRRRRSRAEGTVAHSTPCFGCCASMLIQTGCDREEGPTAPEAPVTSAHILGYSLYPKHIHERRFPCGNAYDE